MSCFNYYFLFPVGSIFLSLRRLILGSLLGFWLGIFMENCSRNLDCSCGSERYFLCNNQEVSGKNPTYFFYSFPSVERPAQGWRGPIFSLIKLHKNFNSNLCNLTKPSFFPKTNLKSCAKSHLAIRFCL